MRILTSTIFVFAVGCSSPAKNNSVFVRPNDVGTFSLAIQSQDLTKVRELLLNVPKQPKNRTPSDDAVINLGLYVATLDGLRCSAKIVGLLEVEYEARVTRFGAVQLPSKTRTDSQTPLCLDVMARSLAHMENQEAAVLSINNYYVDLLANYNGADLELRIAAYNQLLREASKLIAEVCKRSQDDPICALRTSFIDFSTKTKGIKSRALEQNSKDVLKILGVAETSLTQIPTRRGTS